MTKKTKTINAAPKVKAQRFKSLAPPPKGGSPAGWHAIESAYRCWKKYQLKNIWKVRIPQLMTPDPLAVGGLFHALRAWWFNQGFPLWSARVDESLQEYIRDAALRMDLPVREQAIANTMKYGRQYIEYWSPRTKPKVIGTEYALSGRIEGLDTDRTARLDDVAEYPEAGFKLCLGECKTTSVSVADVVQEYTLHGQTMKQDLLWRVSPEGQKLHGPIACILLDIIVKGYGQDKCKFARVPINIYDFSRAWFSQSLITKVRQAELITKESIVERNVTACTQLIGRMRVDCEYKPLCQMGPSAALRYVDNEGTSLGHAKYIKGDGAKPWD